MRTRASRRRLEIEYSAGKCPPPETSPPGNVSITQSPLRDVSPLLWWRSRGSKVRTPEDARAIRNLLSIISNDPDPQWQRALRGDAAAAIGIAIRVIWRQELLNISSDAAMAMLLACVLEDDPAATVVLSVALDRRARAECALARLSRSLLISIDSS